MVFYVLNTLCQLGYSFGEGNSCLWMETSWLQHRPDSNQGSECHFSFFNFCFLRTKIYEVHLVRNYFPSKSILKQDCIPVGCVPPACCPYLPACTAPGGVLLGGYLLLVQGGLLLGGCLPLVLGKYLPLVLRGCTPACNEQTSPL